jgi:DNA-3-methyladenine glycosylase I
MSYCNYVKDKPEDNVHKIYHDFHYGTPIEDDNELFGRLILEINQAGLSWDTILKKEANFRKAYAEFSIEKVALFKEKDIERLLNDAGIIRNRLKINAAIHNAQQIIEIQKEFTTFHYWLNSQKIQTKEDWVRLFKKQFKFVGGEIVGEFLMSIGLLDGAHSTDCFRFKELIK